MYIITLYKYMISYDTRNKMKQDVSSDLRVSQFFSRNCS